MGRLPRLNWPIVVGVVVPVVLYVIGFVWEKLKRNKPGP